MKKIFILFVAASLALVSCKKSEGCTDSKAANYNPDADSDNGSCTYKGNLVFWWKQSFSDSCAAYGVTAINVSVDNSFIGSAPVATQYFAGVPECFSSGALTHTADFGTSKTKRVNVKYELFSGATSLGSVSEDLLIDGGCDSWELEW
ncbi:MAG: hypothetical protein RL092_1398 [Bacteroidota bacterium]|jgi:hypothetical protein